MKFLIIILAVMTGLIGASFSYKASQEKKPWPVPDNYKTMKNPVASMLNQLLKEKPYGEHTVNPAMVQREWVTDLKQRN